MNVYPTGVTLYEPEKCWNGYTLMCGGKLLDMNGGLLRRWDRIGGLGKMFPGGCILGLAPKGDRVLQIDWKGNVEWEWDAAHYGGLNLHHDFQREGSPVGYFAPDMNPLREGKTLVLGRRAGEHPDIAPGLLLNDCILELSWQGEVLWEWKSEEHFHEMGFDEAAKNALYRGASLSNEYDGLHSVAESRDTYDWLHSNNINYLGPNKWYDEGDQRFHPENIIWDARRTNTIGIIGRDSGEFVWRVGPDYTASPELWKLGPIIGQHHAHLIPKGLPGAGNILVFDNGGYGGYGEPNPGSPTGVMNAVRPYSRVVEFDPLTLDICWEYSAKALGYGYHFHDRFYSPFISSAQRLPNGNTLICEGDKGHVFEVTAELEMVWEYVVPPEDSQRPGEATCYRAYRIPYEWVPQVKKPQEKRVTPPVLAEFRISPDE